MATESYTAFHHVQAGTDLKKKKQELLTDLKIILKGLKFKKKGVISNEWEKGEHSLKIITGIRAKKSLFSGILPGSRPFKPNVWITVTWDRELHDDMASVLAWLKKIHN